MLRRPKTRTPGPPIPPEAQDTAREAVDAAFTVHQRLAPGLLESVYEICLAHELKKRRLKVERQLDLPVLYDGIRLDGAYRLDLVVNSCLVVEIKTVEELLPVHHAQALTYLKVSGKRLALLINFNVPLIKDGIRRIAL